MSDSFYQQLNQIITLSEKILLWLSNEFEQTNNDEEELNAEELLAWNLERDKLIKLTFNEEQSENYSEHLTLINQMVALDNQLTEQAAKNKLVLKTSLLKMKKNQKAASTYKKY
ncbi:hypothetical protein WNY51_16305 [Pseudocolwellia sp. AS88]|uniref:hypothetical protein n=1 Tax=Pseudocolwellia sp. AS88 TaxID=3063958 RepID=UPI0026F2C1E1|nr:hypothetical protein [Pseudocolwellia sp. AS88]MDO7085071.1 hypothetical protein [Pseudocolwellia sp. AS88]